jgi:sec-independent protein translocase protein TatC
MAPVPTLERPESPSAREDDTPLIELTDPDEIELEGGRMSFLEHLDELRKRLIASLIGIAIGCVISFIVLDTYIVPFIMTPMEKMLPQGGTLITTEPAEYFMLWLKMGFFGGLLIAMPFMLYQVWLFVAPGLYSHEKRFAIPFVVFASLFFFGGAMFSHYIAFPVTWGFFIAFNPSFVQFMPKIGPAFSLYVKMMLACGAVFQMPVLVFALARMGVVSAGFLLRNFKYAVLIIAIAGAVLSPGGDIASQMILSGPMLVLYVFSIGIAWAFQKRKPATDSAD